MIPVPGPCHVHAVSVGQTLTDADQFPKVGEGLAGRISRPAVSGEGEEERKYGAAAALR